ncbi:NlpC/P60 family protein [Actinosynnema sp. NPDC020468]|uniref:NlpC/P60 family protein n=1 Tax=Actinosynnema sp. NPDC020468 TaxID=3154488 RepID=UPI0033E92ECC
MVPLPASAQPTTESDALKKYNELNEEAGKLNEELLRAQEQQDKNQQELDKANTDLAQAQQAADVAKADVETFRGQVDKLTEASFEGARFNQLSALLVSDSQQDFLNRMSALGILAADNTEALGKLSGAVDAAEDAKNKAADAQKRAQKASDDAVKITEDVKKRKGDLDNQISEVKTALNKLSTTDKAVLKDPGNTASVPVPGGAAGIALQFALDQRGDMYAWGGNGPDTWDCSGLTSKAYAAAGISIPRTSQGQAGVGVSVPRSQIAAGDLVIYNGGTHVAIAVDGSTIVHAATDGVPVKIAALDAPGSIDTIRRVG